MKFTIEVQGMDKALQVLDHAKGLVRNLKPVWPAAEREFWTLQEERFNSEGFGKWAPLSPGYARWKAQAYPGKPILQREGALMAAATGKSGSVVQELSQTLKLGWNGPAYWRYHQKGTSNMPARKVVDLRPQDKQRIVNAVRAEIIQRLKAV